MRVATNSFPNSLLDHLGVLTSRQARLQDQIATGQRIRRPEDDPAAAARILNYQDETRALRQYERNIGNLHDRAQATYTVLRELKKVSDRAGELAVLADDPDSPEALQAYAVEVTQLIERAVQLANTKWNGEHLFAGTRSDQAPFSITQDLGGNITGVSYSGNTSIAQSEIAQGVTLSTHTVGENTSGGGPRGLFADSRFGADLFNHLISFRDHLLAGDTDAINSTDHQQLALDEENLLTHLSNNGVIQGRLEATQNAGAQRVQALEGEVSKEADVDLAESLVRLNQTQAAYQAALQSGARLMSLSLLDYLR